MSNQKMSKISGFKDPLRSKISDYGDLEIDLGSIKAANPYTLSDILEEESYENHYKPEYGHADLETSSNRYQNRGFNQYLQHKD